MDAISQRDRGATGERLLSPHKHGKEQTIITIVYNGEKNRSFPLVHGNGVSKTKFPNLHDIAHTADGDGVTCFVWFTHRVTHGRVCGVKWHDRRTDETLQEKRNRNAENHRDDDDEH